MDGPAKDFMEKYQRALDGSSDMALFAATVKTEPKDLVFAIQCAHIEQVRKCFQALEGGVPEGERRTFAQYLRDLANAYEEKGG